MYCSTAMERQAEKSREPNTTVVCLDSMWSGYTYWWDLHPFPRLLLHRFTVFSFSNTRKKKSNASHSRRWENERNAERRAATNPSCSLSRRSDSVGLVVESSDRLAGRLEKWGRDGGEMHGGEESLPSAPLIGLMRSRVNRRTNERMPLCSGKGYRLTSPPIAVDAT